MNRWFLGFGAVPAAALIAVSCAPLGSPVDPGDTGNGDSGTAQPSQDSGSGVGPHLDSGGPVNTGTPVQPMHDANANQPDTALACVTGGAGPASLPFAVNQYFITSGWEQAQYIQAGPACTRPAGGTSDAGTDGSASDGGDDGSVADAGAAKCSTWTYAPGGVATWAGVDWQYPVNNWGTAPGLAIPAGATAVTFYAWGATGTEIVSFNVGYGATSPDVFGASLASQHLTTTPTQYSIPITGDNYVCNSARMGFGWTAAGATSETFYIDSITWE